ncbi:MAG: DUF5947 family protein [Caldilineaceae bacterium]
MSERSTLGSFAIMRRFVQPRAPFAAAAEPPAQCEFCSASLAPQHRHLLEVASREIFCVCQPCSILFDKREASVGRYQLILDRRLYLPDFRMSDLQWERLRIPVGLAFFFHSTPVGRAVVYYPSPMGPTESLLQPAAWTDLMHDNLVLTTMTPDIEALLVNRSPRTAAAGAEHFLVPIDECYRLVGLLRTRWRGLSGGEEVWHEIGRFFASLKANCVISSINRETGANS